MHAKIVVLCILDGVGWGLRDDGDAVQLAQTPNLDRLMAEHPWCLLQAHGRAVGLPSDDDMGNSEVGHNAMGAGRVFDQGAKLIGEAIRTGRIWQSSAWKRAISGGTLHFLGLVSDGNVHSHVDHLEAMLRQAASEGVKRVRLHLLTDGRDVSGRSALTWIKPLEALMNELGQDYAIASGGGRMLITMDRYCADWPMVQRGWECHVMGQAPRFSSASEAIQTAYERDPNCNDQWIPPFVVGDYEGMADGDAVLLFNFRGDRAIEISRAFDEGEAFDETCFRRERRPNVRFAGIMEYDGDMHIPRHFLVEPPIIEGTVGEWLAKNEKRVFSISETQKFGHVTYFFNGNRSDAMPGEAQEEIASDTVPFEQVPAMKAREVTKRVVETLAAGDLPDLVRLNIANGDMVGHSGDRLATVKAMEVVDDCLGQLEAAVREVGGVLLVTADHGNADEMWQTKRTGKPGAVKVSYKRDEAGNPIPSTSHSLNPVPFVLVDHSGEWALAGAGQGSVCGGLAQVGGTLLRLCDVPVPNNYLNPLVVRRTNRKEEA